ncbi:hypothetical protein M8C21_023549, partial [Ambrosia artemisiifolia]
MTILSCDMGDATMLIAMFASYSQQSMIEPWTNAILGINVFALVLLIVITVVYLASTTTTAKPTSRSTSTPTPTSTSTLVSYLLGTHREWYLESETICEYLYIWFVKTELLCGSDADMSGR